MAQVFDRSSNALARASLVLTGLIVIALGVTLDQLQRSPWVTRQGQRPDQPIPFSHKHHVEGLGLQCQYCHTSVEVSSYAGIPPTKTCINCHAQIWTNAGLLQPVRDSWATGQSIQWIKVHDLPDFVYFNHSIHVNKGIGCASCHGRVDQMPLMYMENSLQMEWCLNCHRNPAVNLRPTSEIYNMAWQGPSSDKPVWCAPTGKSWSHRAKCCLHHQGSRRLRPGDCNAAGARDRRDLQRRAARADDAGQLPEVHQPDRSWPLFDGAVPHSPAQRADQLRDMPPMNKTGNREQGRENSGAELVTAIAPAQLTLAEVRAKLEGKRGKRFWKNLDELAEAPGFHEMLEREFPRQASEWVDAVSRRGFLKVMGASLALAGLAGCTKQPDEPIFPYVKAPEDLILGKPMYFASAFPFPTGAIPVLVKSDAFRPIKVDGNPDHPMSKGKSDVFTQASLLDLYDPDRSKEVLFRGQPSEYADFQQAFTNAVKKTGDGTGIYFLSETVTSPTLAAQWKQVQAKYPAAKLVQWEPVNRDAAMSASKAAFGSYMDAQYKLENADVIVSLDADFLGGIAHPGFLPLAAAYAERHRYAEGKTMNRMYAVESMPTVTGFKAEHRLALKPSEIAVFAQALAGGAMPSAQNPDAMKFFMELQKDLKANAGKCVVIPGEQTPPAVHAAAYALNASLGNVGKTVIYTETVNPLPSEQVADFKSLVADMNAGKVQWLVTLGVNPIYAAPVDLEFAAAFDKVPNTVHLGSHVDETGAVSVWHINQAHYLESWSDARAYDGTISLIQPMIAPMYGGHSAHEVLQALLDNPQMSAFDAVQANAKTYLKGDFPSAWRKALHDGWVEGTAFTATSATPKAGAQAAPAVTPGAAGSVEIAFKSDPSLYDGRYANVGWLQELPKQVTNLSWDNAALMSFATMEALKLEQNDAVEINVNGRKVIGGA